MPPKKKEEKKKEEQPVDDGAERELVEKELVIGYLKSKLGRYQEHGDVLQVENIRLAEDLETQKLNLRDINEFLTNELKARSLTTSALEAKLADLHGTLDDTKKAHEAAVAKLKAEKEKEAEGLRATIAEFEKKAKTMQEFLDRKDQLEREVSELQRDLSMRVKDYEGRLSDQDRSHIQDRERWKRETLQKIKETKIQMMKLTDNQLEMTTKRTIMENEQMSIELSYQSRQTEKLMSKNLALVGENNDLRRQLALSQQTEEELARRNNVYQRTIKALLGKLQEQGSEQEQTGTVFKALEECSAELESHLHLARLQLGEQQHQMEQLQAKVERLQEFHTATTTSTANVAQFLAQCLEDVGGKIVTLEEQVPLGIEDSAATGWEQQQQTPPVIRVLPGKLDQLDMEQRARVLAHLLEQLQVFMHQHQLQFESAMHPTAELHRPMCDAQGGPQTDSAVPRLHSNSRGIQIPLPLHGFEAPSLQLPPIHLSSGGAQRTPAAGSSGQLQHSHSQSSLHTQVLTQQASKGQGAAATQGPGSVSLGSASAVARVAVRDSDQPSQAAAMQGPSRGASIRPAWATGTPSMLTSQGGTDATQQPPMPAVDDLLHKVMSDLRPWGKKAPDSMAVGPVPVLSRTVYGKQQRQHANAPSTAVKS